MRWGNWFSVGHRNLWFSHFHESHDNFHQDESSAQKRHCPVEQQNTLEIKNQDLHHTDCTAVCAILVQFFNLSAFPRADLLDKKLICGLKGSSRNDNYIYYMTERGREYEDQLISGFYPRNGNKHNNTRRRTWHWLTKKSSCRSTVTTPFKC